MSVFVWGPFDIEHSLFRFVVKEYLLILNSI